ncbi:hypothetical protein [Thiomicrorhabdus sp.]|uniref:hypothetical protein n=1 Tax=Thiomicrorhabdus sp. TaxID=2039724 RepID=UPI0029C87EFC|nr:hypothetical protein [Thiomicrorhabdus sp.]
MFKKILKIVGSFFLVLIILIIAAAIWYSFKSSEYTSDAKPFLQEHMPSILSWDYQKLKPLLAESALEEFETERGQKTYRFFSKLGPLKSLGEIQFTNASSGVDINQGAYDVVTFTMPGYFESGEAQISITLTKTDSSYRVNYLQINSDVFLE